MRLNCQRCCSVGTDRMQRVRKCPLNRSMLWMCWSPMFAIVRCLRQRVDRSVVKSCWSDHPNRTNFSSDAVRLRCDSLGLRKRNAEADQDATFRRERMHGLHPSRSLFVLGCNSVEPNEFFYRHASTLLQSLRTFVSTKNARQNVQRPSKVRNPVGIFSDQAIMLF